MKWSILKKGMSLLLALATILMTSAMAVAQTIYAKEDHTVLSLTELDTSRITYPQDIFDAPNQTWRMNENFHGQGLHVAEQSFAHGFITHANNDSKKPTQLIFDLSGLDYRYLTVKVGIDEAQGAAGTCDFTVLGDGEVLKKTSVIAGDAEAPYLIRANISGVKTLTLRVTDGGDGYNSDWGVWGEPTLYRNEADIPVEPELSVTSPVPESVVTGDSIRVSGHASGGNHVRVQVGNEMLTARVAGDGSWEVSAPISSLGRVNITAELYADASAAKPMTRKDSDIYHHTIQSRSWRISSGDTTVKLGLFGNGTLAVTGLINEENGTEWMTAPTVIPFMGTVYVNNKEKAVTWRYLEEKLESSTEEATLTLTFACNELNITMDSVWWTGKGGAVKHSIYVRNQEDVPVTVTDQPTMNLMLSAGETTDTFSTFTINKGGGTPGDAGIYTGIIEEGSRETVNNSKIPVVFINRDTSEGAFVAHEFGTGAIIIEGYETDRTAALVRSGLPENFKTDVPAGDSLYIPVSFIGTYTGDQDAAANVLSNWLFDYNVPDFIHETEDWPHVIFNVWNSVGGSVPKAAPFKTTVSKAAAFGFDRIVLDYGWWGKLGEWEGASDRWPNGMAPVGKNIVDNGMDFVQYVLFHTTDSTKENALTPVGPNAHPEWLVGNGASYDYADLGDEDCVAFIKEQLTATLKANSASGWRSDFSPVQASSVQTNRHKYGVDTEYWNYIGFYEIIDHLEANIENFSYENCCGGGYYKDFATMKRTANIFSTDTYRALDARRTFYDATYVYPACQIAPQVVFSDDNPNIWDSFEKREGMTLGYIYRSVMMGTMYVNLDVSISRLKRDEADFLKRQIEIYKEWIRPLVREADIFHITDRPDEINWDAMQYYDEATGKGIVYVFRPLNEQNTETFNLKGLDAEATYYVKWEDAKQVKTYTGRELMETGVSVTLGQTYDAELLYLQRTDVPVDVENIAWENFNELYTPAETETETETDVEVESETNAPESESSSDTSAATEEETPSESHDDTTVETNPTEGGCTSSVTAGVALLMAAAGVVLGTKRRDE